MNRRVVAITAGVAIVAAASLGTAFALPSRPSTHTGVLKFVANQTAQRNFKTHFIGSDRDVANGHTIGVDVIQCISSSDGKSASCDVAAAFRRGVLYGTFTLGLKDGSLDGKVTGGTRFFKDAAGTIKGHAVSDNQEAVTISYQAP